MSVMQQQTPSQLTFNRRRPGMTEFDSLQDLLEQAGYKETRIFTPVAIRVPSSSAHEPLDMASNQGASTSQTIDSAKQGKTSAHWFNTLWPSSSHNRRSTLSRKQSEPVLSKKGRKAVQKNWMGAWGSTKGSREEVDLPPVPPLPSIFQPSDTELPVIEPSPPPPPPAQRQTLRHASSTNNLWKGSLHHHKSFPAKLREQNLQGKTIVRKESFDGAGVVALVGVGAAKTVAGDLFKSREDQRVSLRQAFGQGDEAQGHGEDSKNGSETIGTDFHDSVGSLVDLQEDRSTEKIPLQKEKFRMPVAPVPAAATLFSGAATPLLSRQDAVAMRNVDCLNYAGVHNNDISGRPSTKGLRKMRSVDALELALSRMEEQRQSNAKAPFQKHATIPESFSTDSLTNEDLASANAITTVVGDSFLGDHLTGDGQFEDAPSLSDSPPKELAIRRSSTPRLVITSPTGMRSPQPLVLEGQEFEPRSISPRKLQMFCPIPSRAAVLQKPEAGKVEIVTKRSTSKRRSRVVKGRGETLDEADGRPPTATSKTAKKRMSKSCNDLRGSAARGALMESSQKSGSEQIRELQRHALERGVVQEVGHHQYSSLHDGSAINAPFDRFDDEDDPFRDFVAVTTKTTSSSSSHYRGRDSAPPNIDRKMSPIPFDHLKRRPLSSTVANSTIIAPIRQLKMEATVSRKKSGVGLACLVQEPTIRPFPLRSSSFSSQGNENAPPSSLQDSPTAHVVKKRSSRIRLGQR